MAPKSSDRRPAGRPNRQPSAAAKRRPSAAPKRRPSAAPKRGRTAANQTAKSARLRSRTPVPAVGDESMRLQKFLASAGVGSRRDCEVLIVEGRIEVDNQVVTELGSRIHPEKNVVTFDGQRVRTERLQYFMLNKPPGVLSTAQDPSGRTRVVDLISSHQRVYNVGRLDKSSEGLILVTNDGTLAQYLTHPSFGIEKVYHVVVRGVPKFEDLQTLKHGVHLMEGVAKVKDVDLRRRHKDSAELIMVLDEGKNREIRRMLAKIGHKVVRLVRVAIGPLNLGDLSPGAHRRLTSEEVRELKEWAERVAQGLPPRSLLKSKPPTKAQRGPRPTEKRPEKKSPPVQKGDSRPASRADAGPSSGSAPHDSVTGRTANPVAQKIASGRPIHIEDLQRSQEIRRSLARPLGTGRTTGQARPAGGKVGSGTARGGGKPRTPGAKSAGGRPRPGGKGLSSGAASRSAQGPRRNKTGKPGAKVSGGRKRR